MTVVGVNELDTTVHGTRAINFCQPDAALTCITRSFKTDMLQTYAFQFASLLLRFKQRATETSCGN